MRSTEEKLLHIPCTVGMNQATSSRLSPTGTFDLVQNCRISGNGVLELRPGTAGLAGTTSTDQNSVVGQATETFRQIQGDNSSVAVFSPSFACTVGNALLVGTSYGEAFAYSTVWQFQGRFSTCLPVRKRYGLALDDIVSADGFGATAPDLALNSDGYLGVCALTATGKVHFYIEDPNGVRIYYYEASVFPAYSRARVVGVGSSFFLALQTGTHVNIFQFTVSGGVALFSFEATVATLSSTSTLWDVVSFGSVWFIAYQSAATTITLTRLSFFSFVATLAFTIPSTATTYISLYCDTVNSYLWLGVYDDNNDIWYAVFDISVAGSITNTVARTVLKTQPFSGPPLFGAFASNGFNDRGNGAPAFYAFKLARVSADNTAAIWYGLAFANSTSHSSPVAAWHYIPLSKPDNSNRIWCAHQSHGVGQTTTRLVLVRFADLNSDGPVIELSSPNQLYVSEFSDPNYFTSYPLGTSRRFFASPSVLQEFYSTKTSYRIDVYEHTSSDQEPHRASHSVGITTAVVGQPVEFYGQSVPIIQNSNTSSADAPAFGAGASEIGFPNSPLIFSVTPSNSGGSIEIGQRSYRAVFEWIDMYGRRHQSAPSPPVTGTTTVGSSSSVALTVSTLNVSQRQAFNTATYVYVRMYRTVAGGTEYHELSPAVIAIDLVSSTGLVTFTDVESDANISQTGFIYTDGNALQNDLAPSCRFVASSEERVWFGGLWDTNIIQASKVIVPGEPIQCTDDPSHQVVLPVPCTGLAYMDGNVVAFGASSIYLISSSGGPNDQGAGSFSPPQQLTRSVGCCDYRSILETNVGIFFQSELGIYLLPRGFGPAQYVGMGVQDVMATSGDARATVLGAASQVSRGNHLAQFLVATAGQTETQAQTLLSYDLDSGSWFEDTLPVAIREIASVSGAEPFSGLAYVLADLNSTHFSTPVLYETAAATNDANGNGSGVAIQQTARTAWVHPFGLGGFGKVNVVMVAVETTGASQALTVSAQTDDGAIETGTWTITTPGVVSYRALYLANIRACTSIQVTIQGSVTPPAQGEFKFISATLEIEPTNGLRLLQDSEKN